jgi:AcrR family transcriptional regulator
VSLDALFGQDSRSPGPQIRTEPIQQRSADRLNTLLDAAAAVVDEVGFDRITTAMVAERAGASIGTVYRYYPDRIAVLHGLRERAVQRFRTRVAEELKQGEPETWWEAVDCAVTAFVELYRSEPGFRILHFADRERTTVDDAREGGAREGDAREGGAREGDARKGDARKGGARKGDASKGDASSGDATVEAGYFARRMADVFAEEFGLPGGPELIFRLEVAVEMADALLSRAFYSNPQGDERFIDECRRITHDYLVGYYGPSSRQA